MRLSKTFRIPIYNCEVYVGVVDNVKKVVNRLYKKHKSDSKLDEEPAGVFFNFNLQKYYVIYSSDHICHSILSHELFHLVVNILKDRDVVNDEEAGSYLMGFVSQQVHQFLRDKKIQIAG